MMKRRITIVSGEVWTQTFHHQIRITQILRLFIIGAFYAARR